MSRDYQFSVARERRRTFLKTLGGGLIGLATMNSIASARANEAGFHNLNEAEGRSLQALGDVLLPGAGAAGIAHYVDDQLSRNEPLLMLKYVDFTTDYTAFYREGLAALDMVANSRHGLPFARLQAAEKATLVGGMAQQQPPEWSGPPSQLFYFITRADAVDVYYGTREGFGRLEIPYMPHISPVEAW